MPFQRLGDPAIFFVGHGTRDLVGTQEFLTLVDLYRERFPDSIVAHGFLELAEPTIQRGIDECVARGARSIVVLPVVLMAAGHAKNDIPNAIDEARRRHPGVQFHCGRHLHLHSGVLDVCRLRLDDAEIAARPFDRRDTVLLVVARGSSDADANSDIAKLARLLAEDRGYGWSAACFSGVTTPLLRDALDRCRRMGFPRVLVLPFFLFAGKLVQRVRDQIEEQARGHPETEFLCAGYLNAHPRLIDVCMDRIEEALVREEPERQ